MVQALKRFRFLFCYTAVLIVVAFAFQFFATRAFAQAIPTCTMTAVPAQATGSANVTLTWSSTGATTCIASGAWSGVKDCNGTAVMQGVNSTRTFSLSARAATGKVTAKWTKVTTNGDGTPATVTGYKLYVADTATGVPSATPIALPATPLEYVFWRAPGEVRAGISGVRSDGVEGSLSNIAGKTVIAAAASCKATVTIAPRPKAPTLTISWLKEILGLDGKPEDRT